MMVIFVNTPPERVGRIIHRTFRVQRRRHTVQWAVHRGASHERDHASRRHKGIVQKSDADRRRRAGRNLVGYARDFIPQNCRVRQLLIIELRRPRFRPRMAHRVVPHFQVEIRRGRIFIFLKLLFRRIAVDIVRVWHSTRNRDSELHARINGLNVNRSAEIRADVRRRFACRH